MNKQKQDLDPNGCLKLATTIIKRMCLGKIEQKTKEKQIKLERIKKAFLKDKLITMVCDIQNYDSNRIINTIIKNNLIN